MQAGLELSREAATAYRAGNYGRAIELYEQSYALYPDANSIHNLGRCYQELGTRRLGQLSVDSDALAVKPDFDHAIELFERYLALQPDAPNRAAVEQRIASLQSQIRLLEQPVPAPVAAPLPKPPPSPAPPAVIAAPDPISPWSFVGMGVGAAGIGAGIVLGVVARASEGQANDPATSGAKTVEAADRAQNLATGANVLFVVGGVLAGAGLVFGIVDWTSGGTEVRGALTIQIGPGWSGLAAHF